MQDITADRPERRSEQLIVQEVAGDVVVYDRETDQVSALTGVDAEVWNACDGERTVGEITETLALPEGEILGSIARLDNADLLNASVSRRAMLRKAALGGAVLGGAALVSLAAPAVAMAGSGGTPPVTPTPTLSYTVKSVKKAGKKYVVKFKLIGANFTATNHLFIVTVTDAATGATASFPSLGFVDGKGAFGPDVEFALASKPPGTGGTLTVTVKVVTLAGKVLETETTTVDY